MLPALLHESSEVMQICCCHVRHLLLVLRIQKEYITKTKHTMLTHKIKHSSRDYTLQGCIFQCRILTNYSAKWSSIDRNPHTLWPGSGDLVHHHCNKTFVTRHVGSGNYTAASVQPFTEYIHLLSQLIPLAFVHSLFFHTKYFQLLNMHKLFPKWGLTQKIRVVPNIRQIGGGCGI